LGANLQKSLTRENFSVQILASIALFIISFFFIFWAGSYFEVDIFPLENRSTIYTTFHTYIFEKFVDAIIITLLTTLWIGLSIRGKTRILTALIYGGLSATAIFTNYNPLLDAIVLASVPLIASFFVYHHFSPKKIILIEFNLLNSLFPFAVLCIAVSGLIITVFSISSSSEQPGWIQNHAVHMFLLFSSISPALILFLMGGSFIKLLTIKIKREFRIKKWQQQITSHKLKRKTKFLFLSFFMLLSVSIALLPHQSFINNENELVGSDSVEYVNWLNNIMAEEKGEFLQKAFVAPNSEDRPLSLILFSGVLKIFPDNPSYVIDHLPIILSPLLVLAVFFLTREITSNDTISLLASFLTAVSFQALIGIYAGLYANLLALIFGYFSIVFLLRFLKRPSGINYLAFSVLLFLMMLSHIYTWTIFILFFGIFLIVSWRLKMFERKTVFLIFLIIVASVAFDSGKSIITDHSGIARDIGLGLNNSSYLNLFSIWTNLSQTSLVYAGGIFGNFLILSLCIYWLLRSNFREIPNLFIAIFLSIGFLPILFGGEIIQSRVLFNIPFQIPAAIGLFYLANQHKSNLLVLAISIWILTMSFQTITNFI